VNALSEWAAKVEAAAERVGSELAITVVKEQARDFLATERVVTPKRTGRLADSETIDSVGGGGSSATATVSPHAIYAEFRNDGGTIHAKPGLGRKGMRPHTLHWGGDGGPFPLSVTQSGSHYVQRAEAAAAAELADVAEMVTMQFLAGI
jgi:bacteriophage HK97-gp10 putative tail-component